MGVESYWLLDPQEPGSIVAYRLSAGAYREVGSAIGEEVLVVEYPFPLVVVPSRLLDRTRP
ncbi:MAG: hypothetical protein ACT4QG_05245 [Sporichthyaceae bacterium]